MRLFEFIEPDFVWIFYMLLATPFGCLAGALVAKVCVKSIERDM